MRVELLRVPRCPNADAARRLLGSCADALDLVVDVIDREGDFPSPTIRVNGVDVMGSPDTAEACCRLDVPTRERVMAALMEAGPAREFAG